EEAPSTPPQYRQPHGRMLMFWGCGEHAGPGQPLVIDFATLGQGEGAQRMMALMHAIAISPEAPPSPARDATYGDWPNSQTRTTIPPNGSLRGDHTVKGDYSPVINFT